MSRPPLPPYTFETAAQKARMAEDAWNSQDPERVAGAYTPDSQWRNRSEFFRGHEAIVAFLRRKWSTELDYRLVKEVWACTEDRIAVRFAYEWHNAAGEWFRSHGNEQWAFDLDGLMHRREASINDVPIASGDRLFHWPSGTRPVDHPGLTGLGLQPPFVPGTRRPAPRQHSVSGDKVPASKIHAAWPMSAHHRVLK